MPNPQTVAEARAAFINAHGPSTDSTYGLRKVQAMEDGLDALIAAVRAETLDRAEEDVQRYWSGMSVPRNYIASRKDAWREL